MLRTRRQRGFSLLEMMMVVVILAIFSSMAYSSMLQSRPRDRLRQASQDLAHRMIQARGMAVSRTTNTKHRAAYVEVLLDAAANEYHVVALAADGTRTTLQTYKIADYNKGADITMSVLTPAAGVPIQFQPNGSTDRPAIIVFNETFSGKSQTMRVTRAGLVRFEN